MDQKELIRFEKVIAGKKRPQRNVLLLIGENLEAKHAKMAEMGKSAGRTVYRVDLSKLFSEYIGETEKNLASLWAKAEQRGWILFFDEADALFGKRSAVKDAHDRYANEDVSHLLRRLNQPSVSAVFSASSEKILKRSVLKHFSSVVRIA
ncbi:AAA family ATPase [Pelagicoccus mobilis]|uniref:AAA family ATPase n=1 Tax=Pelagicoccus mobilis TaxID=415221 RepID=UPI00190399FB|nr:AAA family ATPase [Pelagicoccus mobilis]